LNCSATPRFARPVVLVVTVDLLLFDK